MLSILPLRPPRSVLLTLWCPKSEPLRGAKQTSVSAALLVLKRQRSFAVKGGAMTRGGVIMRTRKPRTPPKTKLKKFGVWGRNRDQLILFIFFLRSSAGSFRVIGCRLDPRKTKKPANGGFFGRSRCYQHLDLLVTGSRGTCYQIPQQFSPNSGNLSSTFPLLKSLLPPIVWVVGLSDDSAQW